MRGIITADLHLRSDRPRCRIDEDWEGTQRNALKFIAGKAGELNCPVYIVGDIFHTPTVPPWVVNMFLDSFNGVAIHGIAGNHDLPFHSYKNVNRSSFGTIEQRMTPPPFDWSHFGEPIKKYFNCNILFRHELIFPSMKEIPEFFDGKSAGELLAEFPDYDFIFTGDYHHNFVYEKNNRYVINPGCMLRQAADMKDYKPGFYFVDTDKKEFEFIHYPDSVEMVVNDYLIDAKEKEDRISAFVEAVRGSNSVSLDFIENVKKAISENQLSENTKKCILSFFE